MRRSWFLVPLLLAGCASGEEGLTSTASVVPTEPAAPPTAASPSDATTSTEQPSTTEHATTAVPSTSTTTTTSSSTTTVTATTPDPPAPDRDFSEVDAIVADFVDDQDLDGAGLIVVDADDGVVHEQYWGEFDADRVSLVASSSKQITAGVLLHLQDQGLLDMEAPVAEAVAWGAANPDITPAQLVSSRSGLVGLFPDFGYPPYICQYRAEGDIEDCAETIFTTPDDDADLVPPDTEFRYGGAQWQVAGGIAEAVSGISWAQLVEEIYVEPCGLESLGYNNHFGALAAGFEYPDQVDGDLSFLPPTDNPNMEGGAFLSVPDYGKLLQMHLDGGRCGDVQVLSAAALEQMYADALAPFGGVTITGGGYGMGWWIDRTTGLLTDPGAYGSVAWLDLEDRFGAYLVIERDAGTGGALAGLLYAPIEDAVLAGRS